MCSTRVWPQRTMECDTWKVLQSEQLWRTLPAEWLDRAFAEFGTVLLHSARVCADQHRSLLFERPESVIQTERAAGLASCFLAIEDALARGKYVAGYLTYEAGVLLQGGLPHALPHDTPLLWFGVYREPAVFNHLAPAPEGTTTEQDYRDPLKLAVLPSVSYEQYSERIARIQRWIEAGDTYQVNYTIPFRGETTESPRQMYEALTREQSSSYAAVVRNSAPSAQVSTVLSCSPELFFRTDASRTILTRPMKGTAPRRDDAAEDIATAEWLSSDAKNCAEHVMIVDLIRNDLGRICEVGSVQTHNLFRVETYATLHQMTTDVQGRLRSDVTWLDTFRALFPSGSITGAPKHRTMQIIQQVEDEPRGVYTGAIGYIAPDGASSFSVAIRTLQSRTRGAQSSLTLHVGGGIVADSTAEAEYAECLLKSDFVRRAAEPLHLVETMRSDGGLLRFQDGHLARMERSARELGFPFDAPAIRGALQECVRTHPRAEAQRVRLTLGSAGPISVTAAPLQHWPPTLKIRLAQARTVLGNPALRHKTNFRPNYDTELQAAKQAGLHESIFANDAGLLTEGCVTNLFLLRRDRLVTPYVHCGVLPGILRTTILQHGLVDESVLPLEELDGAEVMILGNSLRGFYPVQSVQLTPDRTLHFNTERAASLCRDLEAVFPALPKP